MISYYTIYLFNVREYNIQLHIKQLTNKKIMALDLTKIKDRLNSLSNKTNKSLLVWKPKPGKQLIRILPYRYNPGQYSFIELKFHYNINNKTYLSPDSFGRPDPIYEWSQKLQRNGSKEDWKFGKKIEPKLRTYAPIIVRGEEGEGVKFWGFGKQVYEELLKVCNDPDFGDITDLKTGRDITVEYTEPLPGGKTFAETRVAVRPNQSKASDNAESLVENQKNILDLFPELSYKELKDIMEKWITSIDDDEEEPVSVAEKTVTDTTVSSDKNTVVKGGADDDDVTEKFKSLFEGKKSSK